MSKNQISGRIIVLLLLLVLIPFISFSQPLPAKYGKIDSSELKMRVYPLDTTAQAEILCDLGVFDPSTFTFTRHIRLKIFSKEGARYANQVIYAPDRSNIKGCTYNWKDGRIFETKLKEESIFQERIRDKQYRYRVTMPEVVDGSIIELYYTFNGIPFEWRFQDLIPVRWSELRIPSSSIFSVNKVFFGYHPLLINEDWRWVGKDMPAVIEEPFVNSINNYITKVEIELANITIPGMYYEFLASSWDDVNKFLDKHIQFGMQISDLGLFLNDEVKIINSLNLSIEQKLREAVAVIQKHIKWNTFNSVFSTGTLSLALKNKSGNTADINLSLIKLLKKLGFKVYPVVLSTRDNGIISPSFPTLGKLNYVIACVVIDNKKYLLDATDKNLPFGLLPERCLNVMGRILYHDSSDWIDLTPARPEKKITYCNFNLDENAFISGTITKSYYNYASLNIRNELDKLNSNQEFQDKIESESPGMSIQNMMIKNMDSLNLPVQMVFDVTIQNQVDKMGNRIIFNPMLFDRMIYMPFKQESRKYPVDFAYTRSYVYVSIFQIPESYEIENIPQPLYLALPGKKGRFNYKFTVNGNTLRLNTQFDLSSIIFTEDEYENLRQFYLQTIAKEGESVILKKKTAN